MNSNEPNLQSALDWLTRMVDGCLKVYFGHSEKFEVPALSFYDNEGWLADLLERQKPNYQEFTLLMLALAAHLQPNLLNKLIAGYLPEGGDFPEFGGVKGANHRGLLPTGETAQFILAGDDLGKRLEVQRILGSDHWFAQQKMLWLEPVPEGEPVMSGRLVLDAEVVECLTVGAVSKPRFSMDFPAEYIETQMDWNDLVLHPNTSRQIREIEQWIKHNDTLLFEWGMKKKIKPGYRALFYGPPGTGKTLTATLLGKQTGKDVFRIDLSRVV
ncbi:MAG: AAA family ATPase, partial [Methylicorpusculum sp.]|nr:AAA family ATPase [Methylicorpusculum sp.]